MLRVNSQGGAAAARSKTASRLSMLHAEQPGPHLQRWRDFPPPGAPFRAEAGPLDVGCWALLGGRHGLANYGFSTPTSDRSDRVVRACRCRKS